MTAPSIVWFRLDLRLADHPALDAAVRRGPVIPVFIWAPDEESPWAPGAASRWWLHYSLSALEADLRAQGSRLVLRRGPTLDALRTLLRETGARTIYWSRRYEPAVTARDARIKDALREEGVEVESFNSALLAEPWTLKTRSGTPYQVFTPFWNAALNGPAPTNPLPSPTVWPQVPAWPASEPLASFALLPRFHWAAGFERAWVPGEAGAQARLERFVDRAIADYAIARDRPDQEGGSRLSPHLHFGELSPRQVRHAVERGAARTREPERIRGSDAYLKEIGWREFAYHLLHHFPHTTEHPLRSEFTNFPWRTNPQALRLWQRGKTGFPYIDAGLRELWATGWMHNRVRMVVASFLVKDLLLSWLDGARWFWDTLVDADLASNTLGWQWTAGCGADAAPYYRIFNPALQARKFDPDGAYQRTWVPEAGTPAYPQPIIDHAAARTHALAAYRQLRTLRGPVSS